MIKYLSAAASLIFLVAASLLAHSDDVKRKVLTPSDAAVPSEISIRSSVGEVTFLHERHIKDRGIECGQCHHQINAKKLDTPHPNYLKSSWISCKTCHNESEKVQQKVYSCSECHRTNPGNIADETLSAKVVIHKQCWKCHEAGTAKAASKSCEFCHSGKKTLYPAQPLNVDRSKTVRALRR